MPTTYELIETKCSFDIIAPDGSVAHHLEAEVQTNSGREDKLLIRVSPEVDGRNEYIVEYNQSQLPQKMVEEWFFSHFATLRLSSTNLKEKEIEIDEDSFVQSSQSTTR